jgi:hypothetical protein
MTVYAYRQASAESMAMNDTDKLVAAIFAAAKLMRMTGSPQVEDFLAFYDDCLRATQEREKAAQEAGTQQAVDTWKKPGSA